MSIQDEARLRWAHLQTRRHFLKSFSAGIGSMALSSMLGPTSLMGASSGPEALDAFATGSPLGNDPLLPKTPHFPAKAKHVIFLHMAGAPSQHELFDYKPLLQRLDGQQTPPSLLEGKRFAFIRGVPKLLGPQATFKQYGESGAWVSNHLPNFSRVVDDVTFLKAMHTDEFNHAPAQLFLYTGSPRLGRPSLGSWALYGWGSETQNLP